MSFEREPDLATTPELLGVLDELRRREPIFHRLQFGTTRDDFERMTEPGYWEIGASGQRYSRPFVLDMLDQRRGKPETHVLDAIKFQCRELSADVYLLTCTLSQDQRVSRRATIRRRATDGWNSVFHQGTLVASP